MAAFSSLILTASFSTLLTIPDQASALVPHGPIFIWGNGDFTAANGVTGGSGTSLDPYVIEGWEIIAPSPWRAIRIGNTDAHFLIRNVYARAGGVSAAIDLYEASNGVVENSELRGLLVEFQIGRCNNITVRNNSVSGSGGAGIFVAQSDNTIIRGNSVAQNGGAGISLDMSTNTTVTGNTVSLTRIGIDLFYSLDTTITENTVSAGDFGIKVGENSNNATIVDNAISVPSFSAIDVSLELTKNVVMVNNMMSRGGIYIFGDSLQHWNTHIIASSNTVIGKPVRYLKNSTGGLNGSEAGQVIMANCSGINVGNLDVSGVHTAFQIGFSDDNVIMRNHLHGNFYGMAIFSSSGNTVTQNTIHGNAAFGIRLENSTNHEIANNTYHGNGFHGIDLKYSSNNTIRSNTVSSHGNDAISLWKSDNNIIVENVIVNNNRGVHLSVSKGNQVHHNSMIGNGVQADDDLFNQKNVWDDGYPSGGNYWSDYVGVDTRRGPNQDQPGSDAIGDAEYFIAVDNRDRYPLMFPTIMPPPQPPTVLETNLIGMNFEDVAIKWALSPDDGMGFNSVVRYEVYRNTTYEWGGWNYNLIASLPNKTTDFVDNSAGEGDPNHYFYLICAVDVNGKTSCSWNQAGKFTRLILEGPNLLSIPLIQSDESLEAVLQTVQFDRVWTYDSLLRDWKSYSDSKPHKGDLGSISHRIGFWTNVTEDSNLTVAGIVPSSTMLQLKAGWNLLPFPSFRTTYTVSDMKAGTGANRIEGLDPTSSPYFLRVLAQAEPLQTGSGYWVRVVNDGIWAIDNS